MAKYYLKQSQRDYMDNDPFYTLCIHENIWDVDIEFEHTLYYAGKRIQEIFAVVPVRLLYNRNPSAKVKAFNQFIALYRFLKSDNEYKQRMNKKYHKVNFMALLSDLQRRYGFDINYFPEVKKRVFKYKITKDAP